MRTRTTALAAVALAALAAGALVPRGTTEADDPARGGPATSTGPVGMVAAGAGLEAFDACAPLVEHLTSAVLRDPWALGGMVVDDLAMESDAGAADAAAPAPAARDGLAGTSDTNVQVAGVDEGDLVEVDGRRLLTVAGGALQVVDVAGDVPTITATLDLDGPAGGDEAQLLLDGDRLLVVQQGWDDRRLLGDDLPAGRGLLPMGTASTTVSLVDVAGAPTLLGQLDVEGQLVASRAVDGTAHLVVAHRPAPLPVEAMERVWAAGDDVAARSAMKQALAEVPDRAWLPRLAITAADGTTTTGRSLACEQVARPVDVTDPGMLQVLTIGMGDDELGLDGALGVLTDAQAVTASKDRLVVATPVWPQPEVGLPDVPLPDAPMPVEPGIAARPVEPVAVAPRAPQVHTRLHLFALDASGARHLASGDVDGTLLNQFSMSLLDEDLRVATTVGEPWAGASVSGVVVLRREGGELVRVGAVGDLGRGETIHAVRFLGDTAYVVTFRQTDPLYTIDLRDPTAPVVTGELKITGYSAYLHPTAPGRLLGIGQEATLDGQTTGTQVSLFDVADPAAPSRLSQVQVPGASSEAEWDHHAVLVHDGIAVVPFEQWLPATPERPEGYRVGALVVDVDDTAVAVRGVLEPDLDALADPWAERIRRAVVVDGRLVTVSTSGVTAWDLDAASATGTARF